MAVENKLRVTMIFFFLKKKIKSNILQLSYGIKNIEANCFNNMQTEEAILAAATFEGLKVVSFQAS